MKRVASLLLAMALLLVTVGAFADDISWPVHYDEPVVLTSVRQEVGSTGVFSGENVDYENNVWATEILNRYNIKVEYLWTVDSSQYSTKLNLMLASGDLPDFMSLSITQVNDLMIDDMLADVTDLWNHPTDWLTYEWQTTSEAEINAVSKDGAVYALPGDRGTSYPVLFMRKDWRENLGLEKPENFADVLEIARAFALKDPDGNGVDDTIGLMTSASACFSNNDRTLYNAWHAYPGYFFERDGKLVYGTIQPEVKNALAALQALYAEGVIPADFGTVTETQLIADGKQGIRIGQYWTPLTQLQNAVTNDPKCDWEVYPLMSVDDQPFYTQNVLTQGGNYVAISAKCEHPEAVMQLQDFYVEHKLKLTSDEDFTRFVNDKDGNEIWQMCSSLARAGGSTHPYSLQKDVAGVMAGTVDPSTALAEARSLVERANAYLAGDKSLWCWYMIYKDDGPIYWENKAYLEPNAVINNVHVGVPVQTQLDKGATLQKILDEGYTSIIMGADIDSFETVVQTWLDAGGQDFIDEVNAQYGY